MKVPGKTGQFHHMLPLPCLLSLCNESKSSSSDTYRAASLSIPQKISLGRYFILLKEMSLKINFELVKPNFLGMCQMREAKHFFVVGNFSPNCDHFQVYCNDTP